MFFVFFFYSPCLLEKKKQFSNNHNQTGLNITVLSISFPLKANKADKSLPYGSKLFQIKDFWNKIVAMTR